MPHHLVCLTTFDFDALSLWIARGMTTPTPTQDWGVLTLTFHPQVIGRGHCMLLLERLIAELTAMGATFARMDAVAQDFAQRNPLPTAASTDSD